MSISSIIFWQNRKADGKWTNKYLLMYEQQTELPIGFREWNIKIRI